MMNLFANSSSNWVKYDKYEWKKEDNGTLYITPTEDAKPSLYNPVKEYQDMVLAAINIGTLAMKEEPKESLQASIIDFACNYGLLGLMTALPTTPEFITYEAVYLPKNHFIREESLSTEKYLSYFFPFDNIMLLLICIMKEGIPFELLQKMNFDQLKKLFNKEVVVQKKGYVYPNFERWNKDIPSKIIDKYKKSVVLHFQKFMVQDSTRKEFYQCSLMQYYPQYYNEYFDSIFNFIREEFKNSNVYSKEKCKKCFAKFYCSGGCAANSYNFHGNINDAYDIGCELQRKRIECAIMIKAALAED